MGAGTLIRRAAPIDYAAAAGKTTAVSN
jgi:hypothetical protein